jgi:hypothetical protein
MAQSRHTQCADQCPLFGGKADGPVRRTSANPIPCHPLASPRGQLGCGYKKPKPLPGLRFLEALQLTGRCRGRQIRSPATPCVYPNLNGEGGIRTHETVARLHAFQACAFDHSATSPRRRLKGGGNLRGATVLFKQTSLSRRNAKGRGICLSQPVF